MLRYETESSFGVRSVSDPVWIPLQNVITYILDVSDGSMKKAVLHVVLKFVHHEVAVFLIIPLALKATCPSFHTITDVPEVR